MCKVLTLVKVHCTFASTWGPRMALRLFFPFQLELCVIGSSRRLNGQTPLISCQIRKHCAHSSQEMSV